MWARRPRLGALPSLMNMRVWDLGSYACLIAFLVLFVSWAMVPGPNMKVAATSLVGAVAPIQAGLVPTVLRLPNQPPCPACPPCPMGHSPPPPRRMGHHNRHHRHRQEQTAHPPPRALESNHSAAPIPPMKQNDIDSTHKEAMMNIVRFCGDILSTGPLPMPFIIYWSTRTIESTIKCYSKLTLGSTSLSTYAWLTYSVLGVSFEDKKEIIGVDAILVSALNWGIQFFMMLFLVMHEGPTRKGTICLAGLVVHILLMILLLQFPILRWVKSDGILKIIIGWLAAALQVLSEIIPLIKLWGTWRNEYPILGHPPPVVPNFKKITIIARGYDSIVTLYWMQYCISTYEFDAFGVANIICAALSIISFCAHSAWALNPRI